MDAGGNFQKKFLVGFIILANLVGSNDSDGVIVLDGMTVLRKETFFSIFVVIESDVTMINVGFLFRVFPGAFGWEKFNVNNLAEIAEILLDFLFAAIIG